MFVFRKEEQTKAGMTFMENWRWILDDNVHLLEFRHYRFEGMVGANYSNGQLKSDMGILEPGGIHFNNIFGRFPWLIKKHRNTFFYTEKPCRFKKA